MNQIPPFSDTTLSKMNKNQAQLNENPTQQFFIALINDLRYSQGKKRTERTKNFLIYILFSERVFHVICLLISKKSTFISNAMAGKSYSIQLVWKLIFLSIKKQAICGSD